MYIPDLNRVVDFTFKAGAMSEVALGDGSRRPLRKVVQTAALDGKPQPVLDAILWADSGGQVLKLETDMMGGIVDVSHDEGGSHCTGAAWRTARFDEIRNTMIPISKLIPNPRPDTLRAVPTYPQGWRPRPDFPRRRPPDDPARSRARTRWS